MPMSYYLRTLDNICRNVFIIAFASAFLTSSSTFGKYVNLPSF